MLRGAEWGKASSTALAMERLLPEGEDQGKAGGGVGGGVGVYI